MKKIKSRMLLIVIISCYGLFYMATSYDKDCPSCTQIYDLEVALQNGRPYIHSLNSCGTQSALDTICILVRDTTGVNWNALADTACITSRQQNIPTKAFFVLKLGPVPRDTLAKVICP